MKTHPSTRLFGLLCAAALSSCANQSDSTRMPVSATLNPETTTIRRSGNSMSDRVFDEVNSYRRSQGLGECPASRRAGSPRPIPQRIPAQQPRQILTLREKRQPLRLRRARHVRPPESGHVERQRKRGRRQLPGQAAPGVLVELWRTSKDHHHNMTEKWTHSGIGVVVDSDGMVFATQIFATKNHSQLAMRDRMNSF